MKKIDKPIVASFFLYFCISTVGYSQSDYTVGVFYFSGFADDHIHPWSQIESYPERIPVTELMTNNAYTSSNQTTVDTELSIMSNYGISFVLMDWYWTPTYYKDYKKNLHEDGIYNYLKSPNSSLVKFALMWDNITTPIKSLGEGVDLEVWGGGVSSKYWVDYIKGINVDGVFQYNMHSPATVSLKNGSPVNASHTYTELSFSYSNTWSFIKNSLNSLPYLVPVTSGWSKTPWRGTLSDPLHDALVSNVDEFEKHLLDAKSFVDENPILTNKQIAVCCRNEFGEGSYVAPTNMNGYKYLEKIKAVFSLISKVDSGTTTNSGTTMNSGTSTDSGASTDTGSSTGNGMTTDNRASASGRLSSSGGSDEYTVIKGDGDTKEEINNTNMSMVDRASASFKAVLMFQNISNVLISSTISGKILVDEQKNSGDEVAVNSNEPILFQVSDI